MRYGKLGTVMVVGCCLLGLSGCKRTTSAKPAKVAHPATPVKAAAAKHAVAGTTGAASVHGKSNPLCVGPIDLKPATTQDMGEWSVKLAGYKVTMTPKKDAPADALTLGVMSDIKEDTGENLFNIGRYITYFKSKGVQAVVVAGDTGETVDAISRSLDALAAPGWPVFVIVGNREARGVYADGIAAAQKDHPNVVDLNQRRLVQFPFASIVSLPGYYDPRYLHSDTGCQYFIEDIDAIQKVAAEEAKGATILVSHGPPRGTTPQSIDTATEAGNVGDPNMNTLITKAHIHFGIFGNIEEAGGRATDLSGENMIDQGKFVGSFYMNPGPADAVRWTMNDGTESDGMVGLMVIHKDGKAAYWIHRVKRLTAAQEAQATKLAPPPAEKADANP